MAPDPGAEHEPFNVLFLCTGNSARSIMAEAIMNRIGGPKFRAYSAGSMPKGAVHPLTEEVLRGNHFLIDQFRSKSWEEFSGPDAPNLDFVFTVCDNAAAEACPIWPGQPMSAHWGLPDPVEANGNPAQVALAFTDTFRMLRHRIEIFVNLPVASLDRLTLQRRLDEIGQARIPATAR
jgi:arsenate reductase